jgi:site-specific DNA recombinase
MRRNAEAYNIAIYARESRDDNYENYETIESQVGLLKEFVRKNELGRIISIYQDDNVSGTMFDRDGLKRLEADITDKKINAIILKDLSRLGRNNAKTLLFLDYLEEQKVRVITADFRYDSLKDNDTVGIETWANERYCRDLSRKIRATLRYKIEKGEYIGKAPFGYKKSAAQKNKLIIDPGEAEVVKEIYELYCEGYGYFNIAQKLNNKRVSPPAKGGHIKHEWNAVAIGRILCNRVYIGDTVQGISEKINFKSKKTRKLPESEWIITHNTHDPIIDKELFDSVDQIRNSKVKFSGAHKDSIHNLRGLMYCGSCGSAMYARVRNGNAGYVCGNYMKNGKTACDSHYVGERFICRYVEGYISEILEDETLYNQYYHELKIMIDDLSGNEINIQYLEAEVKRLNYKLETTYADRLNSLISSELFKKVSSDLESQISEFNKKIELINHKKEHVDVVNIINEFSKRLRLTGITRNSCLLCIDEIIIGAENGYNSDEILIKLREGF